MLPMGFDGTTWAQVNSNTPSGNLRGFLEDLG